MTTIIRLLVKGSELLNRLRQQQASNRAGQAQKELDRRTEEERRKRVQQQRPAPVFAPDPQRRRIEPIASRKKAGWYFVVVNTYSKRGTYAWPNGATGYTDEPWRLNQGLPATPTGEFIEQDQPSGIAPERFSFDGRVPINGIKFQRIYKPWRAFHATGSSMTLGVSWFKLPGEPTEAGSEVTSLTPQDIIPIKSTDANAQALPYTYYARLKKARGFAVGFNNNGAVLQVKVETQFNKETELMFGVGDQVRIYPELYRYKPSGWTDPEFQKVTNFMMTYWYGEPQRIYTILGVDQSQPGETRYTIDNAGWPSVTLTGLRYWVVKRHDTWDTVGSDEFMWAHDTPGVPAAFEDDRQWSNLTAFGSAWTFDVTPIRTEPGKLLVSIFTEVVRYKHSRVFTETLHGLPVKIRSDQDWIDGYDEPGAVENRVLTFENEQSAVAIGLDNDTNEDWGVRYVDYDPATELYTVYVQEKVLSPAIYPLRPITISKALLRSILRLDLGELNPVDYGNVSPQPDYSAVFIVPSK